MLHLLIADNAAARLFQAPDSNRSITEIYTFINPAARVHERDIVSSRPGRMINRVAGIHQSFEPETSARHHVLAAWVHSLKKPLRALLSERKSEGLIVVASPRLLAALKNELRKHVTIQGELARNLAGLSASTLDKRLRPLLHTITVKRRVNNPFYPSASLRESNSHTSASVV